MYRLAAQQQHGYVSPTCQVAQQRMLFFLFSLLLFFNQRTPSTHSLLFFPFLLFLTLSLFCFSYLRSHIRTDERVCMSLQVQVGGRKQRRGHSIKVVMIDTDTKQASEPAMKEARPVLTLLSPPFFPPGTTAGEKGQPCCRSQLASSLLLRYQQHVCCLVLLA